MRSLSNIIRWKETDRTLQIIFGTLSLLLFPFSFCMSFFILGCFHAAGTIFWMLTAPRMGTLPGRKWIQAINLLTVAIWLSPLILGHEDIAWNFTIAMVFIGPVLGISYFIITNREIKHYKQLQEQETAFAGNPL